MASAAASPAEPDRNCPLCPRLADFRAQARAREPHWHNAPVASFGDPKAQLLIVGLAPGLQGANRIAHDTTLKALGLRNAAAPFAHGAVHTAATFRLYDSYHCSRYNTNTRVLTPEMFRNVFATVRADLDKS
jgi:uracil-DNA glycosylase